MKKDGAETFQAATQKFARHDQNISSVLTEFTQICHYLEEVCGFE